MMLRCLPERAMFVVLSLSMTACAHHSPGSPPPSSAPAESTPASEVTPTSEDAAAWTAAHEAFDRGTRVLASSMITSRRRFIDVGIVRTTTGEYERVLVLVEYAYSDNFHASVNGRNYLCALFVSPQSEAETQQVHEAIEALGRSETPTDNPAYEWARDYELPDEANCEEVTRDDQGTLVTSNAQWRLRTSDDGVVLLAERWGGTGDGDGTMIVRAPREVRR
jgi:hypothetical protein